MTCELAYLLRRTPNEIRALDERDLATLVDVIEKANAK